MCNRCFLGWTILPACYVSVTILSTDPVRCYSCLKVFSNSSQLSARLEHHNGDTWRAFNTVRVLSGWKVFCGKSMLAEVRPLGWMQSVAQNGMSQIIFQTRPAYDVRTIYLDTDLKGVQVARPKSFHQYSARSVLVKDKLREYMWNGRRTFGEANVQAGKKVLGEIFVECGQSAPFHTDKFPFQSSGPCEKKCCGTVYGSCPGHEDL